MAAVNYYGYDAPVEIEFHCERGLAKISADTGTVILNDGREFKAALDPNELIDYGNFKHYWGVSHIKQITNFYQALAKGIEPEITGKEAVKTQALVCAIYESGTKKQKIYL